MRFIVIIGALLLGLLGLLMSVCGGGFFIRMAYDLVANLVRSGRWQDLPGGLVLLVLPAACAAFGAPLLWVGARYLLKQMHGDDRDN